MKENNKTANLVLADMEFFDYLKEKVGERKTRTEAYCDLLEKSAAGYVTPFLKKHECELQDGQCHVTVTDLAAGWHWHRATVRAFLDRLEEMGYISRTRLTKSVLITATFASNPSGEAPASGVGQVETHPADELEEALAGWVNGSLTDDEMGDICGLYYASRLIRPAGESGKESPKRTPSDTGEKAQQIIQDIVARVAVAGLKCAIRSSRFDDPAAFVDFFRKMLDEDWTSLLAASKAVSKAILAGEGDSSGEKSGVPEELRNPFKALWAKQQERGGGLL